MLKSYTDTGMISVMRQYYTVLCGVMLVCRCTLTFSLAEFLGPIKDCSHTCS